MSNHVDTTNVAVLGCGNMGSAIARTLLASGRAVAVWNRTEHRAKALAHHGAEAKASADDALLAAPLTIICLGSTEDVREVLETMEAEHLADRTILNVTSGTPDDARALAAWAQSRGVGYLDGAILAYPEQIGSPDARLLIGGDEQLWNAYRDVVCTLGGESIHTGADHGGASVVDAGLVGAFYISSMVAFVEATRYVIASGISHRVVAGLVDYAVSQLQGEMHTALERIATGDFKTDQATMNVYADASEAFLAAMSANGGGAIIEATARVLRDAVAAGLGDEDLAGLVSLSA